MKIQKPSHNYLFIEWATLFISFPVLLGINSIPLVFRLAFVPVVFLYVCYVIYHLKNSLFKKRRQIKPLKFWKIVGSRWFVLAIATICFVYVKNPRLLFEPIGSRTDLWLKMVLIYTFLSVIPQEFIYRVFYFSRYRVLFKNEKAFFFLNALLFSMAHLMFNSLLVLGLTFVGGYLFAYTYYKTKSLFWVCIEHLIYGAWLFTVGMGSMLGFPS